MKDTRKAGRQNDFEENWIQAVTADVNTKRGRQRREFILRYLNITKKKKKKETSKKNVMLFGERSV
jgi:hypothetical protein